MHPIGWHGPSLGVRCSPLAAGQYRYSRKAAQLVTATVPCIAGLASGHPLHRATMLRPCRGYGVWHPEELSRGVVSQRLAGGLWVPLAGGFLSQSPPLTALSALVQGKAISLSLWFGARSMALAFPIIQLIHMTGPREGA